MESDQDLERPKSSFLSQSSNQNTRVTVSSAIHLRGLRGSAMREATSALMNDGVNWVCAELDIGAGGAALTIQDAVCAARLISDPFILLN